MGIMFEQKYQSQLIQVYRDYGIGKKLIEDILGFVEAWSRQCEREGQPIEYDEAAQMVTGVLFLTMIYKSRALSKGA